MKSDFDKMLGSAGRMAGEAVDTAAALVEKGRDKAKQAMLHQRLGKMYRQLGALVYALEKNGADNNEMIAWYISEIDRIKEKLAALDNAHRSYENIRFYSSEGDGDAMFRGRGGT